MIMADSASHSLHDLDLHSAKLKPMKSHADLHLERGTTYHRLSRSRQEIRLCSIKNGGTDDPLACTLTARSLLSRPIYKCLSYVWGPPQVRHKILLNGQVRKINTNLYLALKQLRCILRGAPIWIDALCINQEDLDEKGEQVKMMGIIYAEAAEVLVWLGSRPQDGFTVEAKAENIGLHREHRQERSAGAEAMTLMNLLASGMHFDALPYIDQCEEEKCSDIGQHSHPRETWKPVLESLKVVMRSQWFDRAWTIQEIVLAKKVQLLYGSQSISWDVVQAAWSKWDHHRNECCAGHMLTLDGDDMDLLYVISCQVLDLTLAKRGHLAGQHIIAPLLHFGSKNATDPRDNVYGLLGLQSGTKALSFEPDYSLTLQEVFIQLAVKVITQHRRLLPLNLDMTRRLTGLPSWVPHWTLQGGVPTPYGRARYTWSLSHEAAPFLPCEVSYQKDSSLTLTGVEIDFIAAVTQACQLTAELVDHLGLLAGWCKFLGFDHMGTSPYVGGGLMNEAFERTMFTDRFDLSDGTWRRLQPSDVELWHEYLANLKAQADSGSHSPVVLQQSMMFHMIAVLGRRLFRTCTGFIGLCPSTTSVGDSVYILGGGTAPFVLRRSNIAESTYVLLGHCYVHGIMDGQAASMGFGVQEVTLC